MLAAFAWPQAHDAVWHILAGLAVLMMIRRLKPAGLFYRIAGVYVAIVLFSTAVSPRDPLTGQAMLSYEAKTFIMGVGLMLGLAQVIFRIPPE